MKVFPKVEYNVHVKTHPGCFLYSSLPLINVTLVSRTSKCLQYLCGTSCSSRLLCLSIFRKPFILRPEQWYFASLMTLADIATMMVKEAKWPSDKKQPLSGDCYSHRLSLQSCPPNHYQNCSWVSLRLPLIKKTISMTACVRVCVCLFRFALCFHSPLALLLLQ